MGDIKKIVQIIISLFVYWGWIYLVHYLESITGLMNLDSDFYLIVSLLVRYVGGIMLVVRVQDLINNRLN